MTFTNTFASGFVVNPGEVVELGSVFSPKVTAPVLKETVTASLMRIFLGTPSRVPMAIRFMSMAYLPVMSRNAATRSRGFRKALNAV